MRTLSVSQSLDLILSKSARVTVVVSMAAVSSKAHGSASQGIGDAYTPLTS
jgi:hypothetical protein